MSAAPSLWVVSHGPMTYVSISLWPWSWLNRILLFFNLLLSSILLIMTCPLSDNTWILSIHQTVLWPILQEFSSVYSSCVLSILALLTCRLLDTSDSYLVALVLISWAIWWSQCAQSLHLHQSQQMLSTLFLWSVRQFTVFHHMLSCEMLTAPSSLISLRELLIFCILKLLNPCWFFVPS